MIEDILSDEDLVGVLGKGINIFTVTDRAELRGIMKSGWNLAVKNDFIGMWAWGLLPFF